MSNYDIKDLMQITARNLAQIEPDPTRWATWLIYLAECLESEAMHTDHAHPEGVEIAFEKVRDALSDRLIVGRW